MMNKHKAGILQESQQLMKPWHGMCNLT